LPIAVHLPIMLTEAFLAAKRSTRESPVIFGPSPDLQHNSGPSPPRHSIRIQGCDQQVYNVIKNATEEEQFARMIGASDIYAEHAREDALNLSGVAKMKPAWDQAHEDVYEWTDCPRLKAN
jgi:hypothetical protein